MATTKPITAEYSFQIDLPPGWEKVQLNDAWADIPVPEYGGAALTLTFEVLGNTLTRPALLAYYKLFVTNNDETEFAVIMASLSATVYANEVLPEHISGTDGQIRQGVKITDDISADFYEQVFTVASSDGKATVVLTFSTPNLPLVTELSEGFAKIAATARLEIS